MPTSIVVSYTLDRTNRIVDVGGCWDNFALENDAANLLEPHILGREISEFVTGNTTRIFLFTMLDSSRVLDKPLTRPYRCDSPQYRRFMEMTLEPHPQGIVKLRHRLIRVEAVEYPIKFTIAPENAPKGLIKRCSMCNQINIKGDWLEASEAARQGLLTQAEQCQVIYGVCENCQRCLPKLRS
jgi:hypothetical protein